MKIAFITDDGVMISQHFGRAGKYLVVDIQNEKEESRELRDKMGHTHFRNVENNHSHEKSQTHNSPADHSKHVQMMNAIEDCDVVVCGGMGRGAFQSIQSLGIQVFMTDTNVIEEALNAYLKGKLRNMSDLVH